MSDDDAMDRDAVAKKLNDALALQYRSALAYTVAAGSLRGVEYAGAVVEFSAWGVDDLRGAQALIEKLISIGAEPVVAPAELSFAADPAQVLQQLITVEDENVAALHAAIEDTGQEPASEALEHLLEHEIMRKQRHLDTIRRMTAASASAQPDDALHR